MTVYLDVKVVTSELKDLTVFVLVLILLATVLIADLFCMYLS